MADAYTWHEAQRFMVEGKMWSDAPGPFGRLPLRVKSQVSDFLWSMGERPAGITIRFITNSKRLRMRWRVGKDYHVNKRETACMVGGIDCYGRAENRQWFWAGCAAPEQDGISFESPVNGADFDGQTREYRIYLPIGEILEELSIGVLENAAIDTAPKDDRKPVVMYGTSIVHGYCVSRPGMTHPAMLQRRLDYPFVNLGFGGVGRMDAPIGELLAEIDAALYVVDCLPNMDPATVNQNMEIFTKIIRAKRPQTPILFVGTRRFGDAAFIPGRQEEFVNINKAQKVVFDRMTTSGVKNLYLFEDHDFFGDDGDGTIDGSHPTDLGATRLADKLEPEIRKLLANISIKSK
jgi:lysophospholipase L1-like esterase